ncbi:MAG TPA: L-2-hydroxyglutarate oxidase [Patescibacteria group bacterium]|nr:L-2-hydroxyglutarate oxidase [Patescibacteria group bacterium]
MDDRAGIVVIGGGLVGLAVAMEAGARFPGHRILVLEKEDRVAAHQSGRNSGVVHSGLYYRPGSLKARLCVEGGRLLRDFCREHGLPYEERGKVVVATTPEEAAALDGLLARGRANGVPGLERLDAAGLRAREPHAAGVAALLVPHAAITDYARVAQRYADVVRQRGGEVRTGARVVALRRDGGGDGSGGDGSVVETTAGAFGARLVVNCAGLFSDVVARMDGVDPRVRIVPFRGEYYALSPRTAALVRGLIYPVPDPRFPFLGVHFTPRVTGGVEAGPNAVLALAREGYRWADVDPAGLARSLAFPGFRRLLRRHWRTGLMEMRRSLSKRAFLAALRRLMPTLELDDLRPGGSGVRAMAVDPDGAMVDDFRFAESPGRIHVLNVPSPAATASIAIGRHIVSLLSGIRKP